MALKSCLVHNITYNDRLDPTCPQCTLAGLLTIEHQVEAVPGQRGAPREEA